MIAGPDGDFAAAIALADVALKAVLGDPAVWDEEAARDGEDALPWPLQARGEGYPQLLRILATASVQNVLQAMLAADGLEVPADPANGDFQTILRVVRRAVDAADAALRSSLGGTYRLDGKREFVNWLKEREVDAAVRSGRPRAEALEALGFSRAAAYRAMKRKR